MESDEICDLISRPAPTSDWIWSANEQEVNVIQIHKSSTSCYPSIVHVLLCILAPSAAAKEQIKKRKKATDTEKGKLMKANAKALRDDRLVQSPWVTVWTFLSGRGAPILSF